MSDCPPNQIPSGRLSKGDLLWESLQSEHPFPLTAMVSVTGRCDLACGHCELRRQKRPKIEDMETNEFDGIFQQLADCKTLFLTLTGGEPTLRKDLESIVESAAKRRFYVGLKTNGASLDDHRTDSLIDAGLSSVNISLYSPVPDDHDRFVGRKGAFEKSVGALKRCQNRGLRAKVSVVLMEWNADAVFGLLDLCDSSRFNYTVDLQIAPAADGSKAPLHLRPSFETIARVLADKRLLDLGELVATGRRDADSPPCQAARSGVFINHDGEVRPCARLPWSMGNLRSSRFEEIWMNSEVRQRLLDIKWSDLPVCSTCERGSMCSRCPAIALVEHGEITAESEVACTAARAMAAFYGAPVRCADVE